MHKTFEEGKPACETCPLCEKESCRLEVQGEVGMGQVHFYLHISIHIHIYIHIIHNIIFTLIMLGYIGAASIQAALPWQGWWCGAQPYHSGLTCEQHRKKATRSSGSKDDESRPAECGESVQGCT